jgi:hypothetical protein
VHFIRQIIGVGVGLPRKSFLRSTKSKLRQYFILISLKLRCSDFPKFRFRYRFRSFASDEIEIPTKSKFRRNFMLISSKFRCFDFSNIVFDVEIGISISEFGAGFGYQCLNLKAFFTVISQNCYFQCLWEF